MTPITWLLRAKRWVENPPSPNRVKFIIAIIGICALIYLIEKTGFWPDWATTENRR